MNLSDEELQEIFVKGEGHCFYCRSPIDMDRYGSSGSGGWEIDHYVARSEGGTSDLSNLVPACRTCNRGKGMRHGRSFDAEFDRDSTVAHVYDIAGLPEGTAGLNRHRS